MIFHYLEPEICIYIQDFIVYFEIQNVNYSN